MPIPPDVAEIARRDGAVQDALVDRATRLATDAVDQTALTDPTAWRDAVAAAGPQLLELQAATVAQADSYVIEVLAAQNASTAALAELNPDAFVDITDGGGSWLRNLVYAPPATYRNLLLDNSRAAAASAARFVAAAIAGDGVRDTGRAARGVAIASRPRALGYVRMLVGRSCARCAVLAGRRYRVEAFRRHPRCDCINVPAAESRNDWTTNPQTYFESLDRDEQDAVFTKAGAAAIRLSSNVEVTMGQVVNARDGITTVSSYGREIQTTTYGTSVRGLYGGYDVQPDGSLVKRATEDTTRRVIGTNGDGGTRTLRFANTPRLLPDEIFQLSTAEGWDRAELVRQLQRFGYLL